MLCSFNASLTAFPLADEIEHHHRMGQERHHRREDPVRDVARHVGAAQAEHDGRDETDDPNHHGTDERLSHGTGIMAPSPFVAEWVAARPARRTTNHERQPRALDVAMGRGRHAVVLARAGFKTFGVDSRLDAVRDAVRAVAAKVSRCVRGART
jgi:hypothetical protein